jgi:hypothetical protein
MMQIIKLFLVLTIIVIIVQLHEVLRKAMSSANAKELVSGSKSNRLRSSSFSQDRWATFLTPVTLVSPFSVTTEARFETLLYISPLSDVVKTVKFHVF